MTEPELLLRIAATLKQDVAPAVDADYPKTQAFMASIILQKLSRQIARAPAHARATETDLDALLADLQPANSPAMSDAVRGAIEALAQARDAATLCRLIEALYGDRTQLGERRFVALLARVRSVLRADIERRLEYAE